MRTYRTKTVATIPAGSDVEITILNTHGGARPGAGRKPINADDPTERHNLTAPASIWRLLERLGDGNRSEGLRILADLYPNE